MIQDLEEEYKYINHLIKLLLIVILAAFLQASSEFSYPNSTKQSTPLFGIVSIQASYFIELAKVYSYLLSICYFSVCIT
jgi:hypothetical protein